MSIVPGYIRQVGDLIAEGEEIKVVNVAGYAYKGTLVSANYGLLRVMSNDGTAEFLINPASVASVEVKVAEA